MPISTMPPDCVQRKACVEPKGWPAEMAVAADPTTTKPSLLTPRAKLNPAGPLKALIACMPPVAVHR